MSDNKKRFSKALNQVAVDVMANDLKHMHSSEEGCKVDYIQRIYSAALAHPHTNVKDLLKQLNITATQYNTMRSTHLSIPQYRKQCLGVSRFLSSANKEIMSNNLKGKDSKKRKKRVDNARGGGEDIPDGESNLRDRMFAK